MTEILTIGISEEWMKRFRRLAILTLIDGIEMDLGIIKSDMARSSWGHSDTELPHSRYGHAWGRGLGTEVLSDINMLALTSLAAPVANSHDE